MKLNLFIWNKMRFLGPSVWGWWTWLHGYNSASYLDVFYLVWDFKMDKTPSSSQAHSLKGKFWKNLFILKGFKVAHCGTVQCLDSPQKKWKEKLEEFSTYFYGQTTLIKVNTAKVRRTVWKQWKFLFKYFSWHILKVLIATITRETSEILKNPKSDVSTRRHSILINWALNQTIPPPAPFLQVFFK